MNGRAETETMFTPFRLRDVELGNRIVVSPMCMYSAVEGEVGDFHLVHLAGFARGGAGLVLAEMTAASETGRISPFCAGLYDDRHIAGWSRIVDFVHRNTPARIGVQLGHAGRKAATVPPSIPAEAVDAALLRDWPLVSASAIAFDGNSATPAELDLGGMEKIIADHVAATRRADACGFDVIELQFAHGYLLSSFLSPLSNRRSDAFGGPVENRMRFPVALAAAVRSAWPQHKPLFVRVSAFEWEEGGATPDDHVAVAKALKEVGVDLVDVSSGSTTSARRPPLSGAYNAENAGRIRALAGVPTMCPGNMLSAVDVEDAIASGKVDLCAVGRRHLFDPFFALHAAHGRAGIESRWARQYQAARFLAAG